MARKETVIGEDKLALLSEFEDKVNSFCGKDTDPRVDIKENVTYIHNWVQEGSADMEAIKGVEDVVKTSMTSLDDLTSGDPARVIKGCLNIASSVLTIVGGPYGAAASSICNIIVAIISHSSPRKPDMATEIIQEVRQAIENKLHEHSLILQDQKFRGLTDRVKNMMAYMRCLHKVPKDEPIPDRALFETDFPQFIGELASCFDRCRFNSEEAYKRYVESVVLYCKAQTAYVLLLVNITAAFKSTGRVTAFIEEQLKCTKEDAIAKLAFHSDEKQMRIKSPPLRRHQTLLTIYVLRNPSACKMIEEFRESLGMTKMPPWEKIQKIAYEAHHCFPEDVTQHYPRPHATVNSHFFQLINHTDFPIKVKFGKGSLKRNELIDAEPRTSCELTKDFSKMVSSWSTRGVFVTYLDGQMRSNENMFDRTANMKAFEFALSWSLIGSKKSAILDTSDDLHSTANPGTKCWEKMNQTYQPESQYIYFDYKEKSYIAFSKFSSRGRNNCRTCRFVLQEYDPQKMRLSAYEEPDEVDYGYTMRSASQTISKLAQNKKKSAFAPRLIQKKF